jgi:DNA-binding LytR/AlgR family response regulator
MDILYSAIIIDDVEFCIEILQKMLLNYKNISVVDRATNVIEAQKQIKIHQPDLVFLDVELNDKNGLDLYRNIQDSIDWSMQVILYSSHNEFLEEGFHLSVFDYLKKPVTKENLDIVIQHFLKERKKKKLESDNLFTLLNKNKIRVTTATGIVYLNIEEIIYFEYDSSVDKQIWYVYTIDSEKQRLNTRMHSNDILNFSPYFVKTDCNHIINYNYLYKIENDRYISMKVFDKIVCTLPISRTFFKDFNARSK